MRNHYLQPVIYADSTPYVEPPRKAQDYYDFLLEVNPMLAKIWQYNEVVYLLVYSPKEHPTDTDYNILLRNYKIGVLPHSKASDKLTFLERLSEYRMASILQYTDMLTMGYDMPMPFGRTYSTGTVFVSSIDARQFQTLESNNARKRAVAKLVDTLKIFGIHGPWYQLVLHEKNDTLEVITERDLDDILHTLQKGVINLADIIGGSYERLT